ncbi:complex III assembly factor LYRM7 [Aplysia californica]|uniref:Complex III assembly factor LYRM7 n=1 Tax=Aplysia californica TaxID=6500 RepID=A0ABM1A6R6_APLCA|nr:complex III assembly factor LYRM7 [Aplysia californica]
MNTMVPILAAFKDLHRARKQVFDGDAHALAETRNKINQEFRKNLSEQDSSKIDELLVLAGDVSKLLRTTVVQLRQKDDDTYELRVTKDTEMRENTLFDEAAQIPPKPRRKKCSDAQDSSKT